MTMRFHHVQLAIPVGGEDEAQTFWVELLGFDEIVKPLALADRGGRWFRNGEVEIHCGVEDPFSPAKKAHPAFEVEDLVVSAALLQGAGYLTKPDNLLVGYRRFYANDPFGNRLEFLARG